MADSLWYVCRRGLPISHAVANPLGMIAYRSFPGGPLVETSEAGGWFVSLPNSVGEIGPFWLRSAARDFVTSWSGGPLPRSWTPDRLEASLTTGYAAAASRSDRREGGSPWCRFGRPKQDGSQTSRSTLP